MELLILTILLAIGALAALPYFYRRVKQAETEKAKADENYSRLLSQKKSSEIVLGQVTEKLVPFLDVFTHDPTKATFLGQPIDYIVFEEDGIVFIEIKSGHSKLTSKQRKIKKLVKEGKVRWEEIRIKPEG